MGSHPARVHKRKHLRYEPIAIKITNIHNNTRIRKNLDFCLANLLYINYNKIIQEILCKETDSQGDVLMKFVFLDQDIRKDFLNAEEIIAPLRKRGEVVFYDDVPCSQEVLYERAKDADVVIFAINQLENPLIERLKNLKHVQFMGIGYKNYVDEEFCASKGIKALGVGEYGSNAVAEYSLALMLSLFRGITIGDSRMKKHDWNMNGLLGRELSGSTVGIIGTGAIGGLVARKVSILGGEVIAFDIKEDHDLITNYGVKYTSLECIMKESDIVSVHLKYTKSTEKMISANLLHLMKPDAFFMNTARAQVVDYDALYEILQKSKIRGAAVDVHYGEPPANWKLTELENVISTPHIGYYTGIANTNLLRKSVESVINNI